MKHQTISFIKSAIRILGYGVIGYSSNLLLTFAAIILVVSGIIGIVEEVGHE